MHTYLKYKVDGEWVYVVGYIHHWAHIESLGNEKEAIELVESLNKDNDTADFS